MFRIHKKMMKFSPDFIYIEQQMELRDLKIWEAKNL